MWTINNNNVLHSATILLGRCEMFGIHLVDGTDIERDRIQAHLDNALILVTALSPVIGYQATAYIAESAQATGSTLKEVAFRSGRIGEADYDRIMVPRDIIGNQLEGA